MVILHARAATDWNGTWLALNDPLTNAGVVILRQTTSNPAQLMLENDGSSNSSAVDLLKPMAGWTAPVTETVPCRTIIDCAGTDDDRQGRKAGQGSIGALGRRTTRSFNVTLRPR